MVPEAEANQTQYAVALYPLPSKSEGFQRLPRHVSSSTGAGPRAFTVTAQWLLLAVLLHWTQSAHDQTLC